MLTFIYALPLLSSVLWAKPLAFNEAVRLYSHSIKQQLIEEGFQQAVTAYERTMVPVMPMVSIESDAGSEYYNTITNGALTARLGAPRGLKLSVSHNLQAMKSYFQYTGSLHQVKMARLDRIEQSSTMMKDGLSTFFEITAKQEKERLFESRMKSLNKQAHAMEMKLKSGIGSQTQQDKLLDYMDDFTLQRNDNLRDLSSTMAQFAAELGQEVKDVVAVNPKKLATLLPVSEKDFLRMAYAYDNKVPIAYAGEQAAMWQNYAAEMGLWPSVDVSFEMNREQQRSGGNNIVSYNKVSLNVSHDLSTGFNAVFDMRDAASKLRKAHAEAIKAKRDRRASLQRSWQAYTTAKTAYEINQSKFVRAERILAVSEQAFEAGKMKLDDLVDEERHAFGVFTASVDAKANYLKQQLMILQLCGKLKDRLQLPQ